jgi:hypothetical protein
VTKSTLAATFIGITVGTAASTDTMIVAGIAAIVAIEPLLSSTATNWKPRRRHEHWRRPLAATLIFHHFFDRCGLDPIALATVTMV